MGVLSDKQVNQYRKDGFLLVSGLIPANVAAEAEAAMWREIGARPDDEATWEQAPRNHHALEAAELVACYTPRLLEAAAVLSGDDPSTVRAPSRAYVINVFPREGEWRWPGPHIDHAIKEHGHKTFPRAFRVAAMTFLSDVSVHGGGTVVWPGSAAKLEAMAKRDPDRYETMWALNQELRSAGLGEPLELTPRRGDVLFYHYLCAHSGSMNTSDRVRLAMNMKW